MNNLITLALLLLGMATIGISLFVASHFIWLLLGMLLLVLSIGYDVYACSKYAKENPNCDPWDFL